MEEQKTVDLMADKKCNGTVRREEAIWQKWEDRKVMIQRITV